MTDPDDDSEQSASRAIDLLLYCDGLRDRHELITKPITSSYYYYSNPNLNHNLGSSRAGAGAAAANPCLYMSPLLVLQTN